MQPQIRVELPVNSRDLELVDIHMSRAIAAGDPLIAAEHGNSISKTITKKGIALARLLYGMRSNWPLFRAAGIDEDFADFVDAHMIIKGRTAVKYANMYESVFENQRLPATLKEQLSHKPIKHLLLLTAGVREGTLTEDELEDIAILDYGGVIDIVRKARGDATSSKTRVYGRLVQRESTAYPKGTLVVYSGNGNSEPLGYINLQPRTEAGQQFLARMKNIMGLEDIR